MFKYKKLFLISLSLLFSLGLVSHAEAVYPVAGRRKLWLNGLLLLTFIFIGGFSFTSSAYGAANVYYSVGQDNTTNLMTGTPNLTSITSGVATFDTAQTGNIGVGDVVVANSISYYISSKTSTSVWNVVTNTGAVPGNVSSTTAVTSIKRVYNSLSSAVTNAGTLLGTTDLTSGSGYILNIPCYYDSGPDTTSVVVSGYTTSETSYIKIYTPNNTVTEANVSQRHSGKWDGAKYNFQYTNYNGYFFKILTNYTITEGLQMKAVYTSAGGGDNRVIYSAATYSAIRSNIIVAASSAPQSFSLTAISSDFSNSNARIFIYNNIVYNFKTISGGGEAFKTGGDSGNNYIYNNTVYNSDIGFFGGSYVTTVIKNNIVYNNTTDYSGTFSSASTNNLSKDATAPGAGACPGANCYYRSKSLSFVNTTSGSEDFHLVLTDTAAIGLGANLANDATLPFSTDVDSNTRGLTWDIGADQLTPAQVYFSVGQSTADLKTGTPNVVIASGVATFDTAQTGNIGVGDVMVVNSISYYIASKTSTTIWNVVTATGATPTNISSTALTSIKRVYTSLNSAVSGASTLLGTTDLTSANVILNIPCYYDSGPDTTAVTVSGYTTSATNYIKIYTPNNTTTEANNSQRHQGKWDSGKYWINAGVNADAVDILSSHVIFDGIQMDGNMSGWFGTTIAVSLVNSVGSQVSNCIIKNIQHSNGSSKAIYSWSSLVVNIKIFNNIIYSSTRGIQNTGANSWTPTYIYIYNNTVYNCPNAGIVSSTLATIAKNNIVSNCGVDYTDGGIAPFDATSSNNISYDATSPNSGATDCGGHSCRSQTVSFVSTVSGSEDFHLSLTDTAAKNAGADLSADANLPFSTDIDGQTRNLNGLGWDIGADEAATQIFYSVGQNTTDHKTGTPTVTVSGTTATFSVAQTATNMGVGDKVTYTGGTCYISGKTNVDQMHWSCVSATGGTPVAVIGASVTSIAHVFNSLNGAVNAGNTNGAFDASHLNTKDLVTGNYQLNIPCYYDTGADTTAVTVQSWTTSATNYVRIYTPYNTTSEVNQTQRHSGKWDDGKYNLSITPAGLGIVVNSANVNIDGLQIYINYGYSNGPTAISLVPSFGQYTISNSILKANNPGGTYANGITVQTSTSTYKIYNNIIYNFTGSAGTGYGISIGAVNPPAYIYNNTIIGCNKGVVTGGSLNTIYLKNNIAYNNTIADYGGTFNSGSDYNISNDATAPGAHSKISTTVAFVDATNNDFHLSPTDTAAKNAGADLSADPYLPFTTDIDGETRASGKWDIGADDNNNINIQIQRNVNFGRNVNIK